MKTAIIGCGFVADFYMSTIKHYSQLDLTKVYDKDKGLKQFSTFYKISTAKNFDEILKDKNIELILNLTNPREHYKINKQCLENNKHVYSEKPLSMTYKDAKKLYYLAKRKNLILASAPSSLLSLTARSLNKYINDKKIGDVKLIYANFDANMTHKLKPSLWRSKSGKYWPALDEFETGCTYQHAGYILTWLYNFFGPATKVTSFAKCFFTINIFISVYHI